MNAFQSILQRLFDEREAKVTANGGALRKERGLNVVNRQLSDDVQPRPYAGKKSRRTHARTWV
jgi:hypothetical protein